MMRLKTICLLLGLFLLIGCSNKKAQQQTFDPILPVEISVISQTNDNNLRNYVGTTKSEMELPLSFPLGGKLTGIYVKNGQHVNKGALIARIDETAAKSIHDAALATLNQAEDGYNRLKQVHDEGGIPDVRWVQMETDLEKARQTEITTRKNLNECTLRAPQEGFISMGDHTTGENMLPATPFCRIIDMDKIVVEFSVPEKEIGIIQVGDKAKALMQSDKAALDMAKENYRLAELNYRAGMNTITDVLEAHALLLQAKNAITDRQITYQTASRRYHDLSGQ